MLCPLELYNHPPCEGKRVAVEAIAYKDGGLTTVVRAFLWICPMCGTQWRSEEVATRVTTPESRGAHDAPD